MSTGAVISLSCLEARWRFCLLLLVVLLVEDDADDVSLVILHVLHQPLFTGGLKATDAAAEQKHAILHARTGDGELACSCLGLGLGLELHGVLPLRGWGFTVGWREAHRSVHGQTICCPRRGWWKWVHRALGFVLWGLDHRGPLCH